MVYDIFYWNTISQSLIIQCCDILGLFYVLYHLFIYKMNIGFIIVLLFSDFVHDSQTAHCVTLESEMWCTVTTDVLMYKTVLYIVHQFSENFVP